MIETDLNNPPIPDSSASDQAETKNLDAPTSLIFEVSNGRKLPIMLGLIAFLLFTMGIAFVVAKKSQTAYPTESPVAVVSTPSVIATVQPTFMPSASMEPTPSAMPTPTPVSISTDGYKMNVLVLSYFPLTADGKNIDIGVTGDWDASYQSTLQKTREQTKNLKDALEKGTKYLGYKNPQAVSSLQYSIHGVHEYTQAVPMKTDGSRKPDYSKILLDHDICNLVNKLGVNEIWMWAYQGPTYPGTNVPYLNISESKMSGPFGDISNSYRENDMPSCGKTYRLYIFNYQRDTSEALHSWGHQLESEMKAVDEQLFAELWQGRGAAQAQQRMGRCGDVHHPPNSRQDYDYNNPTPQESDCLDWNPAGTGVKSQISCSDWGCANVSDSNNAHLNYLVWNMQNMPGKKNDKQFKGVPLRNWWEVHADFDNVMGSSKRLTAN